jgi:hypothetical protein
MNVRDDNIDAEGRRIAALRESIRHVFPAETYKGPITPHDDQLDDPDLDEEKDLYEALKGRTWKDVPPSILDNQPDGYVLLTDEAFAAFLAAWLMRSLENMDGENEIRDFVVYTFSPKHDMVPDTTWFILRRLRSLVPEQRHTLHSLLTEFSERDPSAFQRRLASEAVALLDSLE